MKISVKWVAVVLIYCSLASPAAAGLFGPGKFEIKQSDDRFSTGSTITVMGQNNRISKKSPVGGTYISEEGLYLEPLVTKNRSDAQVGRVGFYFHNETSMTSDYGNPNSVGIPHRIVFIVDGSRQIAVEMVGGGTEFGGGVTYNSIGKYATSSLSETGLAYLKVDEMAAISQARTIAIKIEGGQRAVIYEERDIAKTFLPNLAAFYSSQIAR